MASTSSPQTEEPFPYPSGVNVADSFTLRLCTKNYFRWKPLMLRFLESHKLSGFVDGTINPRKEPPPLWESTLLGEKLSSEEQETTEKKRQEDWNQQHMQQEGETQSLADWVQERERKQKRQEAEWEESLEEQERWQEWLRRKEWGRECERRRERMLERKEEERKEREEHRIYTGWKRSDDLVRGWIVATVTEKILLHVTHSATAREVWIELEKKFGLIAKKAATSSRQTRACFPYPLGVNVADSFTLRLCATNYFAWKPLMLRFLESHKVNGFVNGSIGRREPLWESSLSIEKQWEEEQLTTEKKRQEDWNQQHMRQGGETQSLVDWVQEREWVQELKQECQEGELEESPEEQERWKEWRRREEWGRECARRRERMVEREEEERQEQEEHHIYRLWKRSDDLVRGWILATVREELLPQVMNLVTAREVWIKLGKILTLAFQPSHRKLYDWTGQNKGQIRRQHGELHRAILTADWVTIAKYLDQNPNAVLLPITWCLETALIVAVRSAKRNNIVKELMGRIEGMSPIVNLKQLLEQKDISGATALHAAVDGGNIAAAKWLVEKKRELANIGDNYGTLPVHAAAGLGNREMVNFLLKHTTKQSKIESGFKLLHSLASSGLYDIALKYLQGNRDLASMEPSPLVVMVQKRTSFLSGTSLSLLERLIYYVIPLKLEDIAKQPQRSNLYGRVERVVSSPISVEGMQKLKGPFWAVVKKLVPPIKSVWETKVLHFQALSLVKWLCHYVEEADSPDVAEILTEPLRNATCVGIHEIVEEILESFPSAIHLKSEKDQSLFHLAIVYRRENVFNLIYQMEEDRRAFLSMPDASTNNALHLAGNLTQQQQLLLRASAAGAALQMQRELQWFEEVGKWMLPHAKEHMNADGKTPQEVFTDTHKDLVKEGERWMKDTANSCTIVAALITTIVFAAAITVPGGSFSDSGSDKKGLPIRLGGRAFTVFGVSDALAMFSSSASLLMFLSILTCRYGEEDFRYSLPRRLIIGLVTLFLSIISMMVAFGATLKIVFGEKTAWLLYPVAALSFAPVALFALWQFPLLYAMIKSTYFPGIFGKKSNRILH